jgi:DNA-directed RNA polymerase specialized sigma24 family protein
MAKRKDGADAANSEPDWLAVIGRSLAYLSLRQAQQERPQDFANVLDKVDFLEGLGLSQADAARAVGSTLNSVQVLRSRKKGAGSGKKK